MKTILLLLSLTFVFSCKNNNDSNSDKMTNETSTEELTMNGTWKQISFYNYVNNKVVDTIMSSDQNKQVKMYTKSKVMWSRFRDTDTIDWFGYGDYNIHDGTLTEIIDYGSKAMNEAIKTQKKYVFKLQLEKDKFSQIQLDDDGNALYSENYVRIE
ncbi:hypothetical protein [Yeosuana sp.]|uniref:hypothetical protein n=1 Tax=Yeosuana sp. TaxID=2529388 RepID=UPI004054A4E9|tara:strand:- start:1264 stop:1731 length:468 start_codon:yes stop_codon:yes gene_type:complete